MMLAPAPKAAFASRAISSVVTGTWCCFGSVSTPFSAQVMTALSLMKRLQLQMARRAAAMMRAASLPFLRQPAILSLDAAAAIDRKIAGAQKDGARLQSIEAPDRVAEMSGVGIVDVLIGEMQQMPRPLPGAERTEGDAGLLLEQMQEARCGQSGLRGAACRRHRLAG